MAFAPQEHQRLRVNTLQVFPYDSVDSTNEVAKRLICEPGFGGPACVIAREQTAGKGTRGRKWASPKDAGIYVSVIEVPDRECGGAGLAQANSFEPATFTQAAGVACVECLRRHFGICVELKPINDLYVNGCKLGGILTEARIEGGKIAALITGIGINDGPPGRAGARRGACRGCSHHE
jgi:BirA family biotin operon repressor/biotin-[acetyl-CoA-carboxylase] ligase